MGDPELIRAFEKDLEYWQKALDDEVAKLPNADDSNSTPSHYSDREVIQKRIDYYKRQIEYIKRKIKQIKRIPGADASQTAQAIRSIENANNTATATARAGSSATARAGHDSSTDHGNSAVATPGEDQHAEAVAGSDDVASPSSATPASGKPK